MNEIHVGTNKKLELLFHNTKNTKVRPLGHMNNLHEKHSDLSIGQERNYNCRINIHFRFLQLEGQVKLTTESYRAGQHEKKFTEKSLIRLDVNLEHKTDDQVLHSLDTVFKYNDFHNSDKLKVTTFVKYFDTKKQEWRVSNRI